VNKICFFKFWFPEKLSYLYFFPTKSFLCGQLYGNNYFSQSISCYTVGLNSREVKTSLSGCNQLLCYCLKVWNITIIFKSQSYQLC